MEDFVCPEGTISMTFDVEGVDPSTCIIDPSGIGSALDRITELSRDLPYHGLVRFVAQEFTKAKQTGDQGAYAWIGLAGLWVVFNHPTNGEAMRKAVFVRLRRDGKSHISWCFGPNGLVMGVAEKAPDTSRLTGTAGRPTVPRPRPTSSGRNSGT